MVGMMVHGPVRYSKGPKRRKQAQGSLKKEVVNGVGKKANKPKK